MTIIVYFSQEFQKGLGILEENNVPFDLSINDPILKHIPKIAAKFPNLKMVIDHLAKPEISKGEEYFKTWKTIISEIAQFPNVFMKLSGMVVLTEPWSKEVFKPYIDHCLDVFGAKR